MNKRIKRIMLALLIVLVFSASSYAESSSKFSDISNHWAKNAIERWSDLKIVSGYPDGTFRPNANITAAELCAVVNRILSTDCSYVAASVPKDAWYRRHVSVMIDRRALPVTSSSYEKPISREDSAVLIAKALNLPINAEMSFTDMDQVSNYAKKYVSYMHAVGYINGYPDGHFGPKEKITRAEIVSILDNVCRQYINKPGTYTVYGGDSPKTADHVFVNSSDVILELEGSNSRIIVNPVKQKNVVTVRKSENSHAEMEGNEIVSDRAEVVTDEVNSDALINIVKYSREDLGYTQTVSANRDTMERAAVALGSMLTYINRHFRAEVFPTGFAHQPVYGSSKITLKKDWNVHDRQSFLETVIRMTIQGHNKRFLEDAQELSALGAVELKNLISDKYSGYIYQETIDIYKKWGSKGIVCWDEFRMGSLAQWGYNAGYITEEEAKAITEAALSVVAYYFDSWKEAYDNYLDGYAWWSRSDITNGKERPRESYLDVMFVFYPDVFDDSLLTADYSKPKYGELYQKLCMEVLGRNVDVLSYFKK